MTEQATSDAVFPVTLTSVERSALNWALEVSRGLLVFDPNLHVLLADETMTPQLLDDLADRLVAARDGRGRVTPESAG